MTGIWVAITLGLLTVIAVALVAIGYRLRWQAEEQRRARIEADRNALSALVANAPNGFYAFDGPRAGLSASMANLLDIKTAGAGLDTVLGALSASDGERLHMAAKALRADSTPFVLTLTTADGSRTLRAEGRAHTPGPAIWFSDVTDSAHRASDAAATRDLLVQILNAVPIPIWRRGNDLRLVDCNDPYARAVERPRSQAVAENAELLGDSLSEIGRALAERARSSGRMESEHHHVVVAGKRRLMELIEVPLSGTDGTANGLVGLAIDRTETEELQDELSRTVSAQAEVLETLSTAIAIYGSDLRIKFYNGAYAELWGLDDAFLDGEPHLNDLLEALREKRQLPEQPNFPAFKREQVEAMRSVVQTEEELLHRPDGTTLKYTISPHPFGGVLTMLEDVTDRLALERGFNTLIDVQRETIENLYEAVAVFGSDGRLALYNKAFVQLWHMPMEQLGERPHVRAVAEAARPQFNIADEDWPQVLEKLVGRATEPDSQTGRIERPDGAVIDWAQVPLPDGQSLFTYLDISDSIRVQRALREQAEALETADRLKSEFIANISYELRTPLNAIVGFAEILENQYFGELNDRQHDYAGAIVQSSQRLIGLINDILDLASIEAGYLELETQEIDPRQLLADLQAIARERAHSRGIELAIDCPEGIGTITGDPRRLKQALFNLVSNAFNFTPDKGKVTLRAARDGETLDLSVIDTGVGIPQEDQANVFHKFVRGQPRKTGAGLGLSLVKSLIELHGGWVELTSAPDRGTRVTCHLPVAGVAQITDDSTSESAPPPGSSTK
ncbi:sensor histidine kinase [Rhodovibrio salinarum]|uniref:histidine kinase n=1 Tax=Rhodovibrio salinarum TaxID=1087 RepID=A0A934QM18_9PROT|nr:ATP-binding protein [Rhodovibrio salinarum]MBK1699306.1 two-component sensor histidine kinase [Rhodovibrio salinarum]